MEALDFANNIGLKKIADVKSIVDSFCCNNCFEIFLDLETTGLSRDSDSIRLISLYLYDTKSNANIAFVIDCFNERIDDVHDLIFRLFDSCEKIFIFNAKFDFPFLLKLGYDLWEFVYKVRCLWIYSVNATLGLNNVENSLEAVCKRYLNIQLNKEYQSSDWSKQSLSKEQIDYALQDAIVLKLLRDYLIKRFPNLQKVVYVDSVSSIIVTLIPGIKVDVNNWEKFIENCKVEKEKLAGKIKRFFCRNEGLFEGSFVDDILLSSPKQVLNAFRKLGYNLEGTSDIELSKYCGDELIDSYREYREKEKIVNSFGSRLLDNCINGIIKSNWHIIGCETGRMSCSKPNLQQIPKGLLRNFIKPFIPDCNSEMSFVKCDYSQIELRVAAFVTQDQRMLEMINNGEDIHSITAKEVIGYVDKDTRAIAKALNFGLLYGMGPEKFKEYLRANTGKVISLDDSRKFCMGWKRLFEGVDKWHRKTSELLKNMDSDVVTTYTLLGRRRILIEKNICAYLNTQIQGSCADAIKYALILISKEIDSRGMIWNKDIALSGVIHDEILLSCLKTEAKEILDICINSMVKAMNDVLFYGKKSGYKDVKIDVEGVILDSWI